MTSPRGAAGALLAVLALVGALSGCGGDTSDPGAGTSSGSSTPASSAPPSGEESGETSPSATETSATETGATDPSATATPATGPAMELDGLTLHVPEGWQLGSGSGGGSRGAYNAAGGPGAMTVSILGAVPGESFDSTLQGALRSQESEGLKPQQLDDRTLDGVSAWVIQGSKKGIALEYSTGGVTATDTFIISFQYLTKPPPDVEATIESVLASVVFDAT